jgi:hypothetical protein
VVSTYSSRHSTSSRDGKRVIERISLDEHHRLVVSVSDAGVDIRESEDVNGAQVYLATARGVCVPHECVGELLRVLAAATGGMSSVTAFDLVSQAADAIHKAYEEAKLAYRFTPTSYTYSTFRFVARAYQLAATARNAMQAAPSPQDHVNDHPPSDGDRVAHERGRITDKERNAEPLTKSGKQKCGQRPSHDDP